MKPSAVTVVVPTFNRGGFLVECLASILAQTRPADEIIVVVDGSTDNTLELLTPYEDRVRVLSKENEGKAAALNFGMVHASHGLIWIFDDDDLAEPDALETLVGLLELDPRADFAYGRHDRFSIDSSGAMQRLGTGYWQHCEPDEFLATTLDDMFAHQQGMLVRKDLYRRAGPFDETLIRSQDYDMQIRLARLGRVIGTDKVVFLQRVHDEARGNASERFGATERQSKWGQFDKVIFRKLYFDLELNKYLGTEPVPTGFLGSRHALLRRASVMARKQVWDFALKDLRLAARVSGAPLSKAEIYTLRAVFGSKYGCDEILEKPEIAQHLCKLAADPWMGAQIVSSLARGLRWKVRAELVKIRCWKSLSYFLIMYKLNRASTMSITAKSAHLTHGHEIHDSRYL
ncbi:MAG: glycosyltransferase family 2 protein [Hyphomonas sp.]